MSTVLIASLGESPVVVTSLFDLLQTQLQASGQSIIDTVEVLCPLDDNVQLGYELVMEGLKDKCDLIQIPFSFEDAHGEEASYSFLRFLARQLREHRNDTVYLSLAGGRKNMSALMAMVTPLYSCVKKLYHIHDKEEHTNGYRFLSPEALRERPDSQRAKWLFPDHNKVQLIELPYDATHYANPHFLSRLLTLTDEQLDDLWDTDPEQAEILEYLGPVVNDDPGARLLPVKMTENVAKQYRKMFKTDKLHARGFATCFRQMHNARSLARRAHDSFPYKDKKKALSLQFHFYKRHRSVERPFFYSEPQDICSNVKADVQHVVITELEIEVEGKYRWGDELVKAFRYPTTLVDYDTTFPPKTLAEESQETILLIPLGTTPMIATQLVALFEARDVKLRKVILIHTKHPIVQDSVHIVQEALQTKNLECQVVSLDAFDDIDSTAACKAFQDAVEKTIDEVRFSYPDCRLELTIAGGRKGMAALTTFAAQRKNIHYVYHTLITDDALDRRVSEETTTDELNRIGRREKSVVYDRLFLRAYEQDRAAFELFKVPVVPIAKG